MNDSKEQAYLYWLHCVPGIGDAALRLLVKEFGSAGAVYRAPVRELEAALGRGALGEAGRKRAEKIEESRRDGSVLENYRRLEAKGIRMVSLWDREYPGSLKKITNPPAVLYYLGALPAEERLALAIIGARECSDYGSYIAGVFGERIASCGVNIISGMARGIDGISQMEALRAGGSTYAVLGCGVDICYPADNRRLYERIQERGGILSPFPPGTPPAKNLFPLRNKIVAGLSDAVLVVEARQKSGTWITVDMALEQGKDVYAVPGRITDRLSDGCNLLIRQGAGIALAPGDILAELSVLGNRKGEHKERCVRHGRSRAASKKTDENMPSEELSGQERDRSGLLAFLDVNPSSCDEILERAGRAGVKLELSKLMAGLVELCLAGKARQTGGNYFALK